MAALKRLLEKGFSMAGDSVPLGFDLSKLEPTTSKLPRPVGTELEQLFKTEWPTESFFLGRIEILDPVRINQEHDGTLLPGALIGDLGFLCIGSDGGGNMYSFSSDDGKVYLIPHEQVFDDYLRDTEGTKLEVTANNVKAIAENSWSSLTELFDWAYSELLEIEKNSDTE